MRLNSLLLVLTVVTMAGCAVERAADVSATPSPQLKQLFADSDEAMLQRNPLAGIFRGDLRYTSTFGEYQSDAYYAAELAAIEHDLAGLARIDRAALNAADQISYDTFKWQREMERRGYEPAILEAVKLRPIDHFNGYHTFFADVSSGQGAARFSTLKDYEDGLERLRGFARALDTTLSKFQAGMDAGIVHPKLITQNVIEQLDGFIA